MGNGTYFYHELAITSIIAYLSNYSATRVSDNELLVHKSSLRSLNRTQSYGASKKKTIYKKLYDDVALDLPFCQAYT